MIMGDSVYTDRWFSPLLSVFLLLACCFLVLRVRLPFCPPARFPTVVPFDMLWKRLTAVLLLAAGRTALAQRSDDESICDYYAAQRYGESNMTTQLLLVQSIVTLAYAGGHEILPDADNGTTGIFNEGLYKGAGVYLRPWFDGSSKKTDRG